MIWLIVHIIYKWPFSKRVLGLGYLKDFHHRAQPRSILMRLDNIITICKHYRKPFPLLFTAPYLDIDMNPADSRWDSNVTTHWFGFFSEIWLWRASPCWVKISHVESQLFAPESFTRRAFRLSRSFKYCLQWQESGTGKRYRNKVIPSFVLICFLVNSASWF